MRSILLISVFWLGTQNILAQKPTISSVDSLIYTAMEMDESQKDSLRVLATRIKREGESIGYHLGAIYFYRLMGWYEEYEGNFEKAISHYLTFLEEARTNQFKSEELQALTDLGSVYVNTNRLNEAKTVFTEGLQKTDSSTNPRRKSAFYNNLGIVHKRQGQLDSALIMYTKSMRIKELLNDSLAISNLKINTAPLLMELKRYSEAEKQIRENILYTEKHDRKADLWHNVINLAEIKNRQKKFNEALKAGERALKLAERLESKRRIAETHFLMSMTYEGLGNYPKALDLQRKGNELKQEFINEESNEQINQLREEFNAEQRERENALLNEKLKSEEQKQLYFLTGLGLLAILIGVIGFAYYKNQKKNEKLTRQNALISEQRNKLTELNDEKNNLISIVSHDLRAPFNAISLWQKTLVENLNRSPLKVAESLEAIEKMTTYGQNLINDILDVEQIEINTHAIDVQEFDLDELCTELINDFSPSIQAKKIEISLENQLENNMVLSDPKLLRRALENLLSNALKFSHKSSEVHIKMTRLEGKTLIAVKDFGVGIPLDEQGNIFSKYGQTSAKPTAGETSTGLGLTIVKRIMDELGGKVSFESKEGEGSTFTLAF